MKLLLSIGLGGLLCSQLMAERGRVQSCRVVFADGLSQKHEGGVGGTSAWLSNQAKIIRKGNSSHVWLNPGGAISRKYTIRSLLGAVPQSKGDTGQPSQVPSYLWVAADVVGTIEAANISGVISLEISAPDTSEKGGHVSMEVTRRARPEQFVEIEAFSRYPHMRRGAWNAVDGQSRSEWVSVYPKSYEALPYIDLEFKHARMVNGLFYLPRQGGLTNGQVYRYEIQVRSKKTDTWVKVISGRWEDTKSQKVVVFPEPMFVQGIRLIGVKTKPDSRGNLVMSAADISPRYVVSADLNKGVATNDDSSVATIGTVVPANKIARLEGEELHIVIRNTGACPVLLGDVYHSVLPVQPEKRQYKPRHSEFTDLNAIGLVCRTCPSAKWPLAQIHSIEGGLAASRSDLNVGDLIVSVQGEPLKKPTLNVTAYPLDEQWLKTHHEPTIARSAMKALMAGEHLQLEVVDPRTGDRSIKTVELPLSKSADYIGFPLHGRAADLLYAELIERVRGAQREDGSWRNMPAHIGEMYGMLALLGTRDIRHKEAIHRAADYLLGLPETGHESSYLELWSMAFKTIALGEYALATGDPRAVAWLDNVCSGLTQGGHVNNRSYFALGHDRRGLPYGYGGLIAPLSHIIVGDSLASRVGVRSNAWEYFLPYIKAAWADNMPPGKQCIGYSAPSRGSGADQAWCRSGLIGLAARLRGTEHEMQKGIVSYMQNHHGFMRRSHGYGGLGCNLGLMALSGIDESAFEEVVKQWMPMIAMQWQKGKGLRHVEPQITNVACVSGQSSDDCYSYSMAALLSVRHQGLHCTGAKDRMWLPYPNHVRPPRPVLIHGYDRVNVARPSLLRYVKARYTTDGSEPTADSPEWKPGMILRGVRELTVSYQASNDKMGMSTSIRLDTESPARWRVISASCGFPDDTVGLDVQAISTARARNAFDSDPKTAFRCNNSSTAKGRQKWSVTVDRLPSEKTLPEMIRVTVPTSKNERKNVNDSAKTMMMEQSDDSVHWKKVCQGLILESRVVELPKPVRGRYLRFTFTSYSGTNIIVPDLKFGYKN